MKNVLPVFIIFILFLACSKESTTPEDLAPTEPLYQPLGNLRYSSARLSDVWGYIDNASGKEYAIVGFLSGGGISIVDVSDPTSPVEVSALNTVPGFDIKVWQHYVYTVTGSSAGMGSIIDIADPAHPQEVGSFTSAHNIFISDDGYIFAEGAAVHLAVYDLNPDPVNPQLVWSGGTAGHDAAVIGNRLFDFHGQAGTNIYNVADKAHPELLGIILDPTIDYHHSGWPDKNGNYLFICDESPGYSNADISVWDIRDLGDPTRVDEYADSTATVHNLYVIGDYAYVAYYSAGFRIFDVSDPANIAVVAHFDTSDDSGEGFRGAFGVYPFAPSGNIYVTDGDNGLFIFRYEGK